MAGSVSQRWVAPHPRQAGQVKASCAEERPLASQTDLTWQKAGPVFCCSGQLLCPVPLLALLGVFCWALLAPLLGSACSPPLLLAAQPPDVLLSSWVLRPIGAGCGGHFGHLGSACQLGCAPNCRLRGQERGCSPGWTALGPPPSE